MFWFSRPLDPVLWPPYSITATVQIETFVVPCDRSMAASGAQSRSINGRQCSKWDQQVRFPKYNSSNFPDAGLVERFCRNPYFEGTDFKAKTIWCVTEDRESLGALRT